MENTKVPVISAKDLNLWYGDFKALKNISLDVGEREITALIGPSGCGKSTFLKTLNRMNDLVPGIRIEGDVRLKGQDIFAREMQPTELRRRVVLNAIERLGFVPNTSAQQLAGKKNGVVGVITSETISDPFYGYFNDRLMKGFQKYGYDVIYAVAQNTKAGCDREISMLYGKVDAYVVVGSCALQKNVEKIVQMPT